METKSRYEVIADLEERKRDLIMDRDSLDSQLKVHEHELVKIQRNIEDKQTEIKEFKDSMGQQKTTLNELIKSTDETLQRFMTLQKK